MEMMAIMGTAFVADNIFGDPAWLPHPITWMGKLIHGLEWLLYPHKGGRAWQFLAGLCLWLMVAGVCWALPFFILQILSGYNIWLARIVECFWCWQVLAGRSLSEAANRVQDALTKRELGEAREKVGWIVGRETHSLSEEEIIKATVETVAENTSDGVVAPLLSMALGGAPLALLYKAINTMDSMLGYRNERYLYFGRWAARMDDVANLIPARLSGLLMIVAAFLVKLDGCGAWKIFWRDRYQHLSPNSAMTEAPAAGALGLQLGGTHTYFGQVVVKPTIGDKRKDAEVGDIGRMNKLMYATSVLACVVMMASRWWIYGL